MGEQIKKAPEREKDKPEGIVVKGGRIIAGVIRVPRLTEKTSGAAKENKYVFSVSTKSNKGEVRRAVEARYGVNVEAVNILNSPGKERRRGRQIGWKPGFKKAIVTLPLGQKIEVQ